MLIKFSPHKVSWKKVIEIILLGDALIATRKIEEAFKMLNCIIKYMPNSHG